MSFIVIALLIAVAGVVIWVLTPSGEAEVSKIDADVESLVTKAKADVATAKADVKADAAKVTTAVDSAVADVKKI